MLVERYVYTIKLPQASNNNSPQRRPQRKYRRPSSRLSETISDDNVTSRNKHIMRIQWRYKTRWNIRNTARRRITGKPSCTINKAVDSQLLSNTVNQVPQNFARCNSWSHSQICCVQITMPWCGMVRTSQLYKSARTVQWHFINDYWTT